MPTTTDNPDDRYLASLLMHASVDLRKDDKGWLARFADARTTVMVDGDSIPAALRKLADEIERHFPQ
jgi:hypothetical protein